MHPIDDQTKHFMREVLTKTMPTTVAFLDTLPDDRKRRMLAVIALKNLAAHAPDTIVSIMQFDEVIDAVCNFSTEIIDQVSTDLDNFRAASAIDKAGTPPSSTPN